MIDFFCELCDFMANSFPSLSSTDRGYFLIEERGFLSKAPLPAAGSLSLSQRPENSLPGKPHAFHLAGSLFPARSASLRATFASNPARPVWAAGDKGDKLVHKE